jgi:prevent-host-death family protein
MDQSNILMNAPKTVGAYEAKTHLPALLKLVAQGHEVVITRHAQPVARLVPVAQPLVNDDLFERILAFRGRLKLTKGETIRELINAGRKY